LKQKPTITHLHEYYVHILRLKVVVIDGRKIDAGQVTQ